MSCMELEDVINKFNSFTQKPVKFLTVQEDIKDDIKNLVKCLYDYTKSQEIGEKKPKKTALPELIVKDFDEEQIWQEIELQNSECWDELVWEVANCISDKNSLKFPVEVSKTSEPESDDADDPSEDLEDLEEDLENLEEESDGDEHDFEDKSAKKTKSNSKSKVRPSIVDDKFFKLQEMEKFLLKEEKNDGKIEKPGSDDESIDMFDDMDDDDNVDDDDEEEKGGGKQMMYKDFFDIPDHQEDKNDENIEMQDEDYYFNEGNNEEDEEEEEMEQKQPKKEDKKVKFAGLSSDDDSDDSNNSKVKENSIVNGKLGKEEKKSDFELRQQRLQQTITRLEEKNLKEAPWQLKGEVDATKRPQNSLLEEVVDFDLTTRPPPIITEQTTITLEDIIRRRIKDKAWDDVVKKEKPVDDQLKFRKTEVIDQSKSKLSLAQVYEAEYLKQKQAMSGEAEEEKEPESHTQIRDAMSKLFAKLDALCHYHYTPKPPQAEVKIVSNIPAISMEEVAPVSTSDATLLAPEEIKRKKKGELMSKEERTQTDKNRERRKKKKLQKQKGQVMKVTDNRNTKKGVEANDKSLKTSKAFFQQLNDDSTSLIKKKNNAKTKGHK